MKNIKLIFLLLFSSLFIVSCNKAEITTSKTTQTGIISTGTLEKLSNLIEEDGNIIYKNQLKGYEISYKKLEDLNVNENFQGSDFLVIDKLGNSVSVSSENYSQTDLKDLESYVDLSIKNIEKNLKKSIDNKETIEINGLKGFKVKYQMEVGDKYQVNLTQYFFENKNKEVFIISNSIFDEENNGKIPKIVNNFKLIK